MISIIIPVYNNQKQLIKALKSIENQIYQDYKVIVVDDGSTVPIETEIRDLRLKIKNIKFHRINHSGANRARNFGFQQSKGEYIIFWDDDVTGKPNILHDMLMALKSNSRASWAYSGFKYGLKSFKLWPFDTNRLKQMPYIHTTSLIRREHFPGFDENIKRLQDWDLWLTMLEKGYTGIFISKILFKVSTGGTMSSWLPKYFYRKPFKYYLPQSIKQKVKQYEEAVDIIKNKHNLKS